MSMTLDARPKKLPWLLAAVVGMVAITVIGVGRAALRPRPHPGEVRTITAEDRAVLVTIDDVAARAHVAPIDRALEHEHVKKIEGGWGVEYDYVDSAHHLEVHSGVHDVFRPRTADQHFDAMAFGAIPGDDTHRTLRDDLFKWGDRSSLSLLGPTGQSGIRFVARKGTKLYSLYITGLPFDLPDAVREVLAPHLDRVAAYAP